MFPAQIFQFCPRCGRRRDGDAPAQPFSCAGCGFHYYFNASLAVAGILLAPDKRALFIRRARDPAKGKLAVPGGFVEIGETAEEALRREVLEEVNLELGPLEFLCSAPNEYPYRGVTYPVLDLAFVATVVDIGRVAALDGVESYVWLQPAEVDLNEVAFPSIRAALRCYLKQGR
jgi:ADP-ribose pyrophosphatase YjhB (NUDIX family)